MLPPIRCALAELDAIRQAGGQTGTGLVGEVRLAVRMPPVGEPLRGLLADWHQQHRDVTLTLAKLEVPLNPDPSETKDLPR